MGSALVGLAGLLAVGFVPTQDPDFVHLARVIKTTDLDRMANEVRLPWKSERFRKNALKHLHEAARKELVLGLKRNEVSRLERIAHVAGDLAPDIAGMASTLAVRSWGAQPSLCRVLLDWLGEFSAKLPTEQRGIDWAPMVLQIHVEGCQAVRPWDYGLREDDLGVVQLAFPSRESER